MPSPLEIKDLHLKSGLPIKSFFNTSGVKYRELGLQERIDALPIEELYNILASDGMLIKRPILTDGSNVLVGFKEKDWQRFFT